MGIRVPKLLMMAKITCNGPNKNTLFNILPNKTKTHSLNTSKQNKNTLFHILPNKTKTHSLIYFQTKQKSEESKQGEQSK